jgi:hypothetical protein
MKHLLLPRNITALAATAFAAIGLVLSSGAVHAETTKTRKGAFKSTDGNRGTFIETVVTNGDTKTDTFVYTRGSDKETSTDITTTTDVSATSHTVSYSHTDYGSTTPFVSKKTVDEVKGGNFGTGTYTNADGVSGTFRTLETSAGSVSVVSAAYIPSTGAGTNDLRVEEDTLGFKVVRTLSVDPAGTTSSITNTLHFRD